MTSQFRSNHCCFVRYIVLPARRPFSNMVAVVLLGDLIEGVATDTGQPKAMVEAIVRAALARVEGAVGTRETANPVGFGRFEVYERSARRGRNLRTGEILKIPATGRCVSE